MANLSLPAIGRFALDLLYPPRCLLCSRGGEFVCAGCLDALPRAGGRRCDVCWLPLDAYDACPKPHEHSQALLRLRSGLRYVDDVRRLVHAFKFNGQSCLTPILAAQMTALWRESGLEADVVVAVPLQGKRERQRGYNQAQMLAGEIAREMGLPVARPLRRARFAGPQVERPTAAERRLNVQGAFALADAQSVAGKRVLIIDDIATTGSTLDACARVLLAAGAIEVTGLTLARED